MTTYINDIALLYEMCEGDTACIAWGPNGGCEVTKIEGNYVLYGVNMVTHISVFIGSFTRASLDLAAREGHNWARANLGAVDGCVNDPAAEH